MTRALLIALAAVVLAGLLGGCSNGNVESLMANLKDDHATVSVETTVNLSGFNQRITRSNPYPPAANPPGAP